MMLKVTCVISHYNEGKHIMRVLEAVRKSTQVDHIVCIDDGSDMVIFNESFQVDERFEFIRFNRNRGKTKAIQSITHKLQNQIVLLLDADLKNLNSIELDQAILLFKENPLIRMILLQRKNAPWYERAFRWNTVYTGERILYGNDLKRMLKEEHGCYELEAIINSFMINERYHTAKFSHSAVYIPKQLKWGLLRGTFWDFTMIAQVIKASNGVFGFLRQTRIIGSVFVTSIKTSPKSLHSNPSSS